jgi:hypothetical protein
MEGNKKIYFKQYIFKGFGHINEIVHYFQKNNLCFIKF